MRKGRTQESGERTQEMGGRMQELGGRVQELGGRMLVWAWLLEGCSCTAVLASHHLVILWSGPFVFANG